MEEGSNAAKIATIALHTAPLILFATRFVDALVHLLGCIASLFGSAGFPVPGTGNFPQLFSEKEKI